MEDVEQKNIDSFIEAVNKEISNNGEFKKALNEAVQNALPNGKAEKDRYFQNLDKFVNFLPNTIKSFFGNPKNLNKLGESWQNFRIGKIQAEDLEKLYDINLELDTKNEIIKKFNMKKVDNKRKLSNDKDVQKALATFKKILNKNQGNASILYGFVNYNFCKNVLSKDDIDSLMEYVDPKKESTGVFNNWGFCNFYAVLKETPSKECIDFMVKNTDFSKLTQDQLICNIITLMWRHDKYLKSPTKESILAALKDILGGQKPYEEFSKALLAVSGIAEKIKLKTIIEKSEDEDVREFAYTLISNGIEIKLDRTNENKKFVVEEGAYGSCSKNVLIECLSKEPRLNQWIRDVFTLEKDDVKDKLAKNCSLIGTVNSMEELMLAKATAIEKFLTQSKDKDRLSRVYGSLLQEKSKKLLLNVKLNNYAVEWALSILGNWFSRDGIIKFDKDVESGSIAELKKFIANWKDQVTDNKNQVTIAANLGSFIWCFSSKFTKVNFDELLDLDIWDLKEKGIGGYGLSNILAKIEDGNISDKFLNKIENGQSVDFSRLWSVKDKCFGTCFFWTIYDLIRTSEKYKKDNKESQKQAIKDVLVQGKKYQWFRNGLPTFFGEAKYDKDGKTLTANDINMENIFKAVPDLKALLDNCGMELKYYKDTKELKVEEKVIVISNTNNIDEEKINNIDNKEEEEPPKAEILKTGEIPKIEIIVKDKKKEENIEGKDKIIKEKKQTIDEKEKNLKKIKNNTKKISNAQIDNKKIFIHSMDDMKTKLEEINRFKNTKKISYLSIDRIKISINDILRTKGELKKIDEQFKIKVENKEKKEDKKENKEEEVEVKEEKQSTAEIPKIEIIVENKKEKDKEEKEKIENENDDKKYTKIFNLLNIKKKEEEVEYEDKKTTTTTTKKIKKGGQKSRFPTWAKILIGLVILTIAALGLLFGFGVIGAAVGTAKTVLLIIGVFAVFFELVYLAILYGINKSNDLPGEGSGSGIESLDTEENTKSINNQINEVEKEDKAKVPITKKISEIADQ